MQTHELVPLAMDSGPPAQPAGAAASRPPRRRSGATTSARGGMLPELRRFVVEHPAGWSHDEWVGLLGTLAARGHDTTDADAIGLALERERLNLVLAGIPGLGERRRTTLLDRYPRLWNLQQAGAEEIAQLPGLNAGLATRIVEAIR